MPPEQPVAVAALLFTELLGIPLFVFLNLVPFFATVLCLTVVLTVQTSDNLLCAKHIYTNSGILQLTL